MVPDRMPKSLLVIGSGAIGIEFASFYRTLGADVTVVEVLPQVLPVEDAEIAAFARKSFEKQGIKILTGAKVTKLDKQADSVAATIDDGKGKTETVTVERVISAVGVTGNIENLGLEKLGVKTDRGTIVIDGYCKTNVPGIYAIGDVAGEPMLAHKASHEGRAAVDAIAGDRNVAFEPLAIPAVVFTDPEIAWAGLTETEAEKRGIKVAVARFPWGASGRAISIGRTDGVTKLVIDPQSERVLGVGICGPGAGELIAEGVLAIEMGATAKDVAMTIHPHPTLSETVMESAEVFFGHATHVYRPKKT
jgi:dihydrolipoamide dehydrogenase